jgi:hypothetical protein
MHISNTSTSASRDLLSTSRDLQSDCRPPREDQLNPDDAPAPDIRTESTIAIDLGGIAYLFLVQPSTPLPATGHRHHTRPYDTAVPTAANLSPTHNPTNASATTDISRSPYHLSSYESPMN